MSEPEQPAGDWPEWVRDWVIPYLDDSILWPVAVSLLGHVVVVIVPLMLDIYRHHNLTSVAVLLAMLAGSAWLVRIELRALGRPRAVTGVRAAMWLVSMPFAWFAERTGVL